MLSEKQAALVLHVQLTSGTELMRDVKKIHFTHAPRLKACVGMDLRAKKLRHLNREGELAQPESDAMKSLL